MGNFLHKEQTAEERTRRRTERRQQREDREFARRIQREEFNQPGLSILIINGVPVLVMAPGNNAAPSLQLQQGRGRIPRGPAPVPASSQAISHLPTRKFKQPPSLPQQQQTAANQQEGSNEELKRCSICLSEYKEGEEIRTLPCLHFFHTSCVDHWLETNARCPVCRQSAVPT